MSELSLGILLLVIAGVMNANFTVPMKFSRRWAWENVWLAWTVLALLVFPPVVAYLGVPDLGDVYFQAGITSVLIVVGCGLGWGVGQVFFGLAVEAVGIGLAFSVILGVSAAVGSLIALVTKHPDKIYSPVGMTVVLGVILVIAGVALCAYAGRRREAVLGTEPKKVGVTRGLVYCLISGAGSALVGLGLAWGTHVVRAAKSTGTPEIWRSMAVWLPLMVAGAIPNLVYCIYLLKQNKTGIKFKEPGTGIYWVLAAMMAIFWFVSTVLYGMSLTYTGDLGAAVAWPVYMSMIVITASAIGFVSGEWRNSGKTPIRIQLVGIVVLIIAVVVLSRGF